MYGNFQVVNNGPNVHNWQYLPAEFANGSGLPASTSLRFYVDPGADFKMGLSNFGNVSSTCYIGVSGYFVDLP